MICCVLKAKSREADELTKAVVINSKSNDMVAYQRWITNGALRMVLPTPPPI